MRGLPFYTLTATMAAYILTLVLVKGHLFTFFRCWLRFKTLGLMKGRPGNRMHLIDCRLCTGAWVSGAVTLLGLLTDIETCLVLADYFVVYGVSYFLATQER